MGVKLRLVQYPCKSGCPSGVRDAVQLFGFAAGVADVDDGAWAARNGGENKAVAISAVRTLDETQKRFVIRTSSSCLVLLEGKSSAAMGACKGRRTARKPCCRGRVR